MAQDETAVKDKPWCISVRSSDQAQEATPIGSLVVTAGLTGPQTPSLVVWAQS